MWQKKMLILIATIAIISAKVTISQNTCTLFISNLENEQKIENFIYKSGDGFQTDIIGNDESPNFYCYKYLYSTEYPTRCPTKNPIQQPYSSSSATFPSKSPTQFPTKSPTKLKTDSASFFPTITPTNNPTKYPSQSPSKLPTTNPTSRLSINPTKFPVKLSTNNLLPTNNPSLTDNLENFPSTSPTNLFAPTSYLNQEPQNVGLGDIKTIEIHPILFSSTDSIFNNPIQKQTLLGSQSQTQTKLGNEPSISPIPNPTNSPTNSPTNVPSQSPTYSPTTGPSQSPTKNPTNSPTNNPTKGPTTSPTMSPTQKPTKSPTKSPSKSPTNNPTSNPTTSPTPSPSQSPTISPTNNPTQGPTKVPTRTPTNSPTQACSPNNLLDLVPCTCGGVQITGTDQWCKLVNAVETVDNVDRLQKCDSVSNKVNKMISVTCVMVHARSTEKNICVINVHYLAGPTECLPIPLCQGERSGKNSTWKNEFHTVCEDYALIRSQRTIHSFCNQDTDVNTDDLFASDFCHECDKCVDRFTHVGPGRCLDEHANYVYQKINSLQNTEYAGDVYSCKKLCDSYDGCMGLEFENGDGSRNLAAYQDEKFDDTYGNTKPLKLHNDNNLKSPVIVVGLQLLALLGTLSVLCYYCASKTKDNHPVADIEVDVENNSCKIIVLSH